MCRFVAYLGAQVVLEDLIYAPQNSLIHQSHHAQERTEPLNGDGFGVGWYAPAIGPSPGVFVSVTPAWSNRNLRCLAAHIVSPCVFAHVRAASPGSPVSEENCHPFHNGPYLWMHNGHIGDFAAIQRRLRASLPDRLYHSIRGSTDSEHAFALFLDLLGDLERPASAAALGHALVETIARLEAWRSEVGAESPAYCNFAVTDGHGLAAVRYVSDPRLEPISLYYSAGRKYECCEGICRLREAARHEQAVIVASERLTERRDEWVRVAPNHLLTVTPDLEVAVQLIPPGVLSSFRVSQAEGSPHG